MSASIANVSLAQAGSPETLAALETAKDIQQWALVVMLVLTSVIYALLVDIAIAQSSSLRLISCAVLLVSAIPVFKFVIADAPRRFADLCLEEMLSPSR